MAALTWDEVGKRVYETGVNKGVLYIPDNTGAYKTGVSWNGLVSVTESPSGAESNPQYADNIKYLNLTSAEEFGATIEAFTYPPEFDQFDGRVSPIPGLSIGQQGRRGFGLSYQTLIGNDVQGTEYGYKIHLIYGAQAAPSERPYNTVNDSPEAITFSWELTTTPAPYTEGKPTAIITVDSTLFDAAKMKALEDVLYGRSGNTAARLPMPDEVVSILGGTSNPNQPSTPPATGVEGEEPVAKFSVNNVGNDKLTGAAQTLEDGNILTADVAVLAGGRLSTK